MAWKCAPADAAAARPRTHRGRSASRQHGDLRRRDVLGVAVALAARRPPTSAPAAASPKDQIRFKRAVTLALAAHGRERRLCCRMAGSSPVRAVAAAAASAPSGAASSTSASRASRRACRSSGPGSRCGELRHAVRALRQHPDPLLLPAARPVPRVRRAVLGALPAGRGAGGARWRRRCGGRFVAGDPGEALAVRARALRALLRFRGRAHRAVVHRSRDACCCPTSSRCPRSRSSSWPDSAPTMCRWLQRLIGAAAGYLFLRLIADFYYYVLKREGLGLGDAKLLALIGALLGWRSLPFVVFVGGFVGLARSASRSCCGRRRHRRGRSPTNRCATPRSRSARSWPAPRLPTCSSGLGCSPSAADALGGCLSAAARQRGRRLRRLPRRRGSSVPSDRRAASGFPGSATAPSGGARATVGRGRLRDPGSGKPHMTRRWR